jgi:hypothetical protein
MKGKLCSEVGRTDSVVKMKVPLSARLTCMIARPGVWPGEWRRLIPGAISKKGPYQAGSVLVIKIQEVDSNTIESRQSTHA